jgi:hypothetical protein
MLIVIPSAQLAQNPMLVAVPFFVGMFVSKGCPTVHQNNLQKRVEACTFFLSLNTFSKSKEL